MNAKYIFLDTETGGIPLDCSLLTGYFLTVDDLGRPLEGLSLELCPDDRIYKVRAEAMSINKIDLVKHDQVAITYKEAKPHLYNYLNRVSGFGKVKLLAVGQNVNFDLGHIFDKLISRDSWNNFVSYRNIDIATVSQFLKDSGKLPENTKTSLRDLGKHFEVLSDYEDKFLHNAQFDVQLSVKVYFKLLELIKNKQ